MHMYTYWEGMVKGEGPGGSRLMEELASIRKMDASAHHKACKHQTCERICNYFNSTRWFVGLHTQIKTCNA